MGPDGNNPQPDRNLTRAWLAKRFGDPASQTHLWDASRRAPTWTVSVTLPDGISLPVMIVAWVVTAASAWLQGAIGFGFAVVSVPVLALAHPALAPVPQLLLSVPLTVVMAVRERHAMDL